MAESCAATPTSPLRNFHPLVSATRRGAIHQTTLSVSKNLHCGPQWSFRRLLRAVLQMLMTVLRSICTNGGFCVAPCRATPHNTQLRSVLTWLRGVTGHRATKSTLSV
jgi:hypothetical protein